mmetsp:Transcript_845/g.2541  ORF Transcript_845/g.2541 Transcript_845/m.2541 type:complete len:207 (-) Transcript_845:176-796(-)
MSALPAGSNDGRSVSCSGRMSTAKPCAPLSVTDFANVTPGMRAEPTVLHISLLRRHPLSEPRSSTASVEYSSTVNSSSCTTARAIFWKTATSSTTSRPAICVLILPPPPSGQGSVERVPNRSPRNMRSISADASVACAPKKSSSMWMSIFRSKAMRSRAKCDHWDSGFCRVIWSTLSSNSAMMPCTKGLPIASLMSDGDGAVAPVP